MEVKCKETGIAYLRPVCDVALRREESVESVVPDTMPDIGGILSTCGTPLIRSKDLSEGRARIEANIPVKVSYQPETGEGLCLLEVNIPISVTAEQPEIAEDCLCSARLCLVALDTKALNPRKISVRADVCVEISCYRADRLVLPELPEEQVSGVFLKEQEAEITTVSALVEKTFVLTDEFRLAVGKPGVAKILCQKTLVDTEEVKAVGSRVVLKGRVRSLLLYLAEDGTPASAEFSTGFSQIVECEGIAAEAKFSAAVLLSGVYYDVAAGSDGSALGMELHLVAQLTVYQSQPIRYLADAYSNCYDISLTAAEESICTLRREILLRDVLREVVETPIAPSEILGAVAEVACLSVKGTEVELPVNVQLFYKCSAGRLHCVRRSYSVKFQAELAENEHLSAVCAALQEVYAVPGAGGVELRLPVEIRGFIFAEEQLRMISEIGWDESQTLDLSAAPSLVLCTVCGEDDLWQIAKENCSSVDAIVQANALETQSGAWQRMLLIPKVIF